MQQKHYGFGIQILTNTQEGMGFADSSDVRFEQPLSNFDIERVMKQLDNKDIGFIGVYAKNQYVKLPSNA